MSTCQSVGWPTAGARRDPPKRGGSPYRTAAQPCPKRPTNVRQTSDSQQNMRLGLTFPSDNPSDIRLRMRLPCPNYCTTVLCRSCPIRDRMSEEILTHDRPPASNSVVCPKLRPTTFGQYSK